MNNPGASATGETSRPSCHRVIVAITGASGAIYGTRLLAHLRAAKNNIETHVVLSHAGALSAHHELGLKRSQIEQMANCAHAVSDIGASIASGSFGAHAMVVAPCSAKTLASIATGYSDNLVARAADVCLKERRRLVLLVREAPLHLVHLRNMEAVTLMGGIIFPPSPTFYHRPATLEQMVDQTLARVLDLLQIEHDLAPRWSGI